MRPSFACAAAALALAIPASAAEPTARAAFSRRRIMPTEQVVYTITLTADQLPRTIAAPQPDFSAFEVLDGPGISTSQSVSIVNGHMSQSTARTFSWVLVPRKEGQAVVPPVAIDLGNNVVVTAGREIIEVVSGSAALSPPPGGGAPPPRGQPPGRPRAQAEQSREWQQRGSRAPQLDLIAEADRDEVWLGQELTLSHVLRFDVNVSTYAPKSAPDFPGFAMTPQDVGQPEGRAVRDPATGAVLYHEATLARWSLVPLATGAQTIPALGYVMTLQEDPFRSIFGGGFGAERQVTAVTQALKILVKPLPEGAPPTFSGAVGTFRMKGDLDATTVKAGDGVTLTISIDGAGSFRGVSAPRLSMPEGLKSFDPEASERAGLDPDGRTQGTKSFRYPILVTREGVHELPAVEWTFFDPSSARYVTRRVGPFVITATPGEQPSVSVSEAPRQGVSSGVEQRGEDIRHISPSLRAWAPDLGQEPPPSWLVPALAAGPALNVLLLLVSLVSRVRTNDPSQIRARSAGKRARARLKEARAALGKGDSVGASDAVARAVGGVVSDRLQLGAQISPGEASSALAEAGAPQLGVEVERLLHECDVTRFASGSAGTNPAELVKRGDALVRKLASARLRVARRNEA